MCHLPLCVYIRTTHTHNYNLNRDQQAYDCATVCVCATNPPPLAQCVYFWQTLRTGTVGLCVMALLPHWNSEEAKFNVFPPACGFFFFNRMLRWCIDACSRVFWCYCAKIDSPVTWLFAKLVTSPSINAYWFCSISRPALFNTLQTASYVRCLASR